MSIETKFIIGIAITTITIITGGAFFFGKEKPKSEVAGVESSVLLANTNHSKGDPASPVTIVEFSDFQCPACKSAQPIVKKVLEKNRDKVYFVYRHYPLTTHKNAKMAAQAAEAAGQQNKFWEMHDIIFEKQNKWSEEENPKETFLSYAQELQLDIEKFKKDIDEAKGTVDQDFADGNKAGVDSTPTFFINGQKYPGVIQESQFQQIIDQSNTSE